MIINRSIHTKGSIYRLALMLVLSFFNVSGSIGLSSYQPQGVATELLLTKSQKSISQLGYCYSFRLIRNVTPENNHQLQKQQQYAVIRFNDLFSTQFSHQYLKFLEIKPTILRKHSSIQAITLQYETLLA